MMHVPDAESVIHLLSIIGPLAGLLWIWIKVRQMRQNEIHGLGNKIERLRTDLSKKVDEKSSTLHEKINILRTDLTDQIGAVAQRVSNLEGARNARGGGKL